MTTTATPTVPGGSRSKRRRERLNIGPILLRLERECRREPTDRETAAAIGITAGTYCELKSGRRSPTFEQLELLCRYFDVPLRTFFPDQPNLFLRGRDGLHWQIRTGLGTAHLRALRDAADWVLQGRSLREVCERLAKTDPVPMRRTEQTIATMVRAGLGLGLVRLVISPEATEIKDTALAAALSQALTSHAPPGCRVEAHVVRNFGPPELARDPIVPFLAARIAHGLVARFLEEHPATYTIGIAGGGHLAALVHTIGRDSSPFPEGGDRRFTLVPLTLEPFHAHHFDLADALVGEFHSRAAMLLGPGRVQAPSFKPFGYLEDHKRVEIDTHAILNVREHYLALDVAIYGCGDRSEDGWIEWTARMARDGFDPRPPTDVCLNPISEDGEPIPLPDHAGQRRAHLGVGIDDIRSLAAKIDKLAVLLASGASKGLPITLVVRAGCANRVVCDQAAARAALKVLGVEAP